MKSLAASHCGKEKKKSVWQLSGKITSCTLQTAIRVVMDCFIDDDQLLRAALGKVLSSAVKWCSLVILSQKSVENLNTNSHSSAEQFAVLPLSFFSAVQLISRLRQESHVLCSL